jgi:membrane fusion protein, heavy metal efflux system
MMGKVGQSARRARLRVSVTAFVALAALGTLAGCGDEAAETGEQEYGIVVITQWNDSTELFLEYPHLLAGEAMGNWAIHLSSMKDFKPITTGSLTVRFMNAGGAAETFTIDSVARAGIFLLDPVIARPGTYQVELTLQSPQVNSRHMLPEVVVFAQQGDVPHAEEDEGGGGIPFLKEQQWQIAWEVVAAREDIVQNTTVAPGEIAAPDGALVEISSSVDGIADATANRNAPSVGQSVRAGQVLVVLSPTVQDGGFAQARARLERLEREVARDERLYAAGAIPERRLVEARHDLEVARAEVNAMGGVGGGDYRLRLTSPISGVVAQRSFVPGGRVSAGTPLFTIVDPRTAWLRVQVPVQNAAGIPRDARATFTTDGSQQVRTTSRLVSVGNVLDPRTRTVPVVFEVADAGALFTFGQLAQAAVPTGGTVTGVVIPNGAIVDDNGTPVAYVQVGGETFERRVLSLGASDGERTHVVAGVRPGEMVVTAGAWQVRLASMSGDDFAGGHAH